MATIAVLGTLDTKGDEHSFVAECIRARGHFPLLIDVGTGSPPRIVPDITRDEVARAGGIDLPGMMATGDRGVCIAGMVKAAAAMLLQLQSEGRIAGVISLGGGRGDGDCFRSHASAAIRFP